MPLFVIGFCYSIPLACGSADAPSNVQWLLVTDKRAKIASSGKTVVSNQM